jgi:CheY-like chemotaxis protein
VLTVDDDPDNNDLVHEILSRAGAEVSRAASVAEAMIQLECGRARSRCPASR